MPAQGACRKKLGGISTQPNPTLRPRPRPIPRTRAGPYAGCAGPRVSLHPHPPVLGTDGVPVPPVPTSCPAVCLYSGIAPGEGGTRAFCLDLALTLLRRVPSCSALVDQTPSTAHTHFHFLVLKELPHCRVWLSPSVSLFRYVVDFFHPPCTPHVGVLSYCWGQVGTPKGGGSATDASATFHGIHRRI